jgi:hypothetical protein
LLSNGLLNTPKIIEKLLKAMYSVGSAPRLYNEDLRPADKMIERERVEDCQTRIEFYKGG